MNKTLLIIRHAHRDTEQGRERDNGLSKKGKKQAERVARFYGERFADHPAELWSSAKKRCVETLQPIAAQIDTEIKIVDALMEQAEDETSDQLIRRIKTFHERWLKSKSEIVAACSHGDWIPLYLDKCVGHAVGLKKGGWAQVELIDKVPRLTWILQEIP